MGFFDELRKSVVDATSGVMQQVNRYKNRDVLEAMMASCALIAAADGHVDASERRRAIAAVRTNQTLSVYDADEAVGLFNKYADLLLSDYPMGRIEILRVVGKQRDQQEVGRAIVRTTALIATEDGNMDADERKALASIVTELGLELSEFDLESPSQVASPKRADRIRLGGNRN